MSKRIEWVDIGKYICIMFVMLSHLQSNTEILRIFYEPFFLTMFFFLSGYVYKETNSFKEHLRKKTRGLLIPWFLFSNLNLLLSSIVSFKKSRNISRELLWNLFQIRGVGDGLWFVAALFISFIPFYFIIKMKKPIKAITVSFVLSAISAVYAFAMPKDILPWGTAALPWHLEYIFQAMLWMVLGYFFRELAEKKFDHMNTTRNKLFIFVLYILVVYLPISNQVWYGSILLSYIKSFIGIVFMIMICKGIKTNWYISYVGTNTLLYFAFHGKVYAVIERVLEKNCGYVYQMLLNNVVYSSILAIVITFLISVILIIPSWIINKWFPWSLGRRGSCYSQKCKRNNRLY